MTSGRIPMNVPRAILLREQGMSWTDIGRRLALEDGRSINYQGLSVVKAVTAWRKRRAEQSNAID